MRSYDWTALSEADRSAVLRRPEQRAAPEVSATVRAIFDDVANGGGAALRRWALQLDGFEPQELVLTSGLADRARAALDREDLEAINFAVGNVRFFHEATKPKPQAVETAPGVTCRRVWRPIETAGLYVPGGSAPLVSTLIMLAEPARVAGVANRIVVTPPGRDGGAHPAVIAAAVACGLDQLWIVGGAQAVAGLALGVFTPKAQKIFGPGNAYVAEAKRYAAGLPGGPAIDLPAGPSELMVVVDVSADPKFVAADLLSQAEHDADAQVLLVSTSTELVRAVLAEVAVQLKDLPRAGTAAAALQNGRALLVGDLEEALTVANRYAPEHLSLQVARPAELLARVHNAGAVFTGAYSAETLGDYVAGPSHVLPTDGAAAAYGGVSAASFMKCITVQQVEQAGLTALGAHAARLARLEGLEAHARAADIRLSASTAAGENEQIIRRRSSTIERVTRETAINVEVDLDRTAPVRLASGIGFFDHMLEQVAHHGGFALRLSCNGDLHIDAHHSVEDCALALGQALREALGDRRGIARFGFVLPMDEAEAQISIDLGGRPYLVFDAQFSAPLLGDYPTEMTEHVFRSLAQAMGATVHLSVKGENDHHKTEACFKALGRALRQAIRIESEETPSTKGVIE
ncbi:histidinol dehydrogenase [Terricaulis sp.]|uniref:histidinol dehydrogenase n=1 Tax=Terricaulis sp. TaxID=2768686 RepID=UPI003783E9D3